jgi:thiol-disulfide isomerase/thioredoxin
VPAWRGTAARLLLLLVVGGGLIAVQAAYKQRPDPSALAREAYDEDAPSRWTGRVAPELSLTTLDGRPFRLADEVGKRVVVLNFFATWCGPCRAEMPELERFQRQAGDSVLLVGIDAEEVREVVVRFIDEVKTTFPVVIDESGEVLKQYGVSSFPTTVVIGADGRIKLYEVGMIRNADVALGRIVEAERAAIDAGRGVTAEAYRTALSEQSPMPGAADVPKPVSPDVAARAARIAQGMPCPCGCDDTVEACGCRTSKAIKARLAEGRFEDRTDAAIMEALNKEFCMKGM